MKNTSILSFILPFLTLVSAYPRDQTLQRRADCLDGTQSPNCDRYVCSTDAGCRSLTGNANSYCQLDRCFTPSSNTNGASENQGCGGSGSNDDNSCQAGLVCYNFACRSAGSPSDPNNCGGSGIQCPGSSSGGTDTCSQGQCQCSSNFVRSGPTTCSECKDGSVPGDGKCVRSGQCSTTNDNCSTRPGGQPTSFCFTSNDGPFCFTPSTNSDGKDIGAFCSGPQQSPVGSVAGDDNNCKTGLSCVNSQCADLSSVNPNQCGNPGKMCKAPDHGRATCDMGSCGVECDYGYRYNGETCVLDGSGMVVHQKRRKRSLAYELCPLGETACPIAGAASFRLANQYQASYGSLSAASDVAGFECLDVKTSVESCGGCFSMEQGVNCLDIPNASGVGCSDSKCVIFSCSPGFALAHDDTACVPVKANASLQRRTFPTV